MSAPKFTPGPWDKSRGTVDLHVWPALDGSARALTIRGDNHRSFKFSETDEANATLAAAAPDLYAALRALVESHEAECKGPECGIVGIDAARRALAKAVPS